MVVGGDYPFVLEQRKERPPFCGIKLSISECASCDRDAACILLDSAQGFIPASLLVAVVI